MIRRHDDAHAFQQAWDSGAPVDGEIAELVRTAEQLCEHAVAEPSADFRSALRERLMTEAESVLVAHPPVRTDRRTSPADESARRGRRRIAAATAAVVTSFGAVSMVTSSAQAMPGEMLYPVKLGVESIQMSFKDEGAERGTYQLERATERLREAEAVAVEDDAASRLPGVLNDFTEQTEAGSATLFSTYTVDGETDSIEQVNDFATRATTVLSAMDARGLPPGSEGAWDAAARSVSALALESARLCGSCERADVDDLIRSVAADDEPQRTDTPEPTAPPSSEPSRTPSGSSTSAPQRAEPSPQPSASAPSRQPSSSPTTGSRGLSGVTDPLVGGLLGNDKQDGLVPGLLGNDEKDGLVPGLLGGLLGGSKK